MSSLDPSVFEPASERRVVRGGAVSPRRELRNALADLRDGLRAWPLWTALAKQDIVHRFRRSVLGPLWITLSFGVMIAALGYIYARVLRIERHDYLLYLAVGLIVWNFVALCANECATSIVQEAGALWQTPLPLSICVFRVIARNLIILAFNAVIPVVLAVGLGMSPSWSMLMALPGLAVLCLNLGWLGIVLAIANTRFRDVSRVVALVLQLALLITPIIWQADRAAHWGPVVAWNPLYHGIRLVRAPILAEGPAGGELAAGALTAAAGWIVAIASFAAFRRRIIYWL